MFFGIMASPQKDEFLKDVWGQICENCDPEGKASFDISEVIASTGRIKDYPAIVIRMPPPQRTTEAYFVAVVLKIDVEEDDQPENPDFAYLTLEKGMNLDGSDRMVLCGWTGENTHDNYGEGPEATPEAFVAAVEARV